VNLPSPLVFRGVIAALLLVAVAGAGLAGCGEVAAPSVAHAHGEPIPVDPSDAPDAAGCDVRLRAEQLAAQRIREELRTDGISVDPVAVKTAAGDPGATTAVLGIPLTASELNALTKSGSALDGASALSYWVSAGAPERFGGIWIDPPGSSRFVVAIVGGDADTLGLARCLAAANGGVDVHFVWANVSLADGRALAARIGNDMQALRASGVQINGVGYQENEGTVIVGVTAPTPELERQLIERYGQPIRLEQQGPVIPD
jgi:hypothetical protein